MLVYCVRNRHGECSGVYHANVNAAIMYFLMGGRRGAYLGNMTNDWDNYKETGANVREYELKEIVKNG